MPRENRVAPTVRGLWRFIEKEGEGGYTGLAERAAGVCCLRNTAPKNDRHLLQMLKASVSPLYFSPFSLVREKKKHLQSFSSVQ